MSTASEIIEAALGARTVADARHVDELLAAAIGARLERPVGDRVNNHGLLATSGSYDFKLIENVTNMQDAVLERAAAERLGSLRDVPYTTPHDAAGALLGAYPEPDLSSRPAGRSATSPASAA